MARGLGLVGLLIAVLLVAWLTLRSSPKPAPAASPEDASSSDLDEDLPPEDISRNPKAAKKYIVSQNCTSDCESRLKLCIGMSEGGAADDRCREQRAACLTSCASAGEPTP